MFFLNVQIRVYFLEIHYKLDCFYKSKIEMKERNVNFRG